MKILRISLFTFSMLIIGFNLYALDWARLHDKADNISLDQALENVGRNPGSLDDLYVLGLTYLNHYQVREAGQAFGKMRTIAPDNLEARWGQAEILRRQHEHGEAVKILDEVTEKYPGYAPALITLGYINYVRGNWEGAIRQTSRAINLGRNNMDTKDYLLAQGLYAASRGMLAHYGGPLAQVANGSAVLRHLNIMKRIAPDSPIVTFGFGCYYMLTLPQLGQDLAKAEFYLKRAISADPLFPDAYVRLAQIYRARGDRGKYEQFISKAIQLDPANELAQDIQSGTCRFICLPD